MRRYLLLLALIVLTPFALHDLWSEDLCSQQYREYIAQKALYTSPILEHRLSLKYPNHNFEEIFVQQKDSRVRIFAYGSLINRASAARTLKTQTVVTLKPAVAFALRRTFNKAISNTKAYLDPAMPIKDIREKAALNVIGSPDFSDLVNGVVIDVDVEDLKNLVSREKGYDLIPILAMSWDDFIQQKLDPEIQLAYTFMSPDSTREGILYTDRNILPNRVYLKIVQDGVAELGSAYLEFWNSTTFLSDGQTSLTEWLKND